MKKGHALAEIRTQSHGDIATEALSKIARVLAYLLTGGSLNRFEAEHIGDHCLNSTIASLANRHGLTFQRQQERVPNCWGAACTVTRYSLLPNQFERARAVFRALM
ncbi:hypothetical protein KH389_01410 [Pseudomonas qingdaonensis]|uniref:Uncharacterized protein n=1 Tax=Pseudomonas qingdaonensis TaxID=2056231 RepID=A0ABX8DUU7_9PSED|nr:hypothetical protein [Pseudomonas qingdaonensis]MEC6744518.1 hypothetical protein [Pseudomonas qingdaonensis]QVL19269.1 hypothetical protein KH389_01410 [Pseudomonas qingdaonensis]